MFSGLKRRSVAIVALVVLLMVNFAAPVSAGYREGRIGCQLGWTVVTESYSGYRGWTWHEHYLEPRPVQRAYTYFSLTIWTGGRNYGTWSVSATPLLSGGASCYYR